MPCNSNALRKRVRQLRTCAAGNRALLASRNPLQNGSDMLRIVLPE
jgi:hypothetical protein